MLNDYTVIPGRGIRHKLLDSELNFLREIISLLFSSDEECNLLGISLLKENGWYRRINTTPFNTAYCIKDIIDGINTYEFDVIIASLSGVISSIIYDKFYYEHSC